MPRLVVLDEPAGPGFPGALQRVWDGGDAAFVLDPRLPRPAAVALLDDMGIGEPVEPGDALVVATSGSTGAPKGVVLTHEALAVLARAGNDRLGVDPATDRWLSCMPLSHMSGLGVVTRALLTGTALTVHPAFDAAAVDRAAAEGCTHTTLVPTAFARIDPSRWRGIVVGGAPVPGGNPPNVVESYGLTETGGGVLYEGVPFDGMEVRVDGDGQILLRGPMLLRCYRDGHDPRTTGGWLPTGDAGRLDAGGRLHVEGRLSELIITGGENVWPAAVERAVRSHPAVGECVVAGRPDPEWGERVVAWVIPADPATVPRLEDVREHVKAQLPAFCAPRQLEVVDDLPRTRSGKVRAPETRETVRRTP